MIYAFLMHPKHWTLCHVIYDAPEALDAMSFMINRKHWTLCHLWCTRSIGRYVIYDAPEALDAMSFMMHQKHRTRCIYDAPKASDVMAFMMYSKHRMRCHLWCNRSIEPARARWHLWCTQSIGCDAIYDHQKHRMRWHLWSPEASDAMPFMMHQKHRTRCHLWCNRSIGRDGIYDATQASDAMSYLHFFVIKIHFIFKVTCLFFVLLLVMVYCWESCVKKWEWRLIIMKKQCKLLMMFNVTCITCRLKIQIVNVFINFNFSFFNNIWK